MKNYFCGWYFKCQSKEKTLAIIPAFHKSRDNRSSSLQIITDSDAWNISLPYNELKINRHSFNIQTKNSYFGKYGMELNINEPNISINGSVSFGELLPIKYDIMGPFRYVPFMQCRHSIVSMMHTVNGKIKINDTDYVFDNSLGYIEGDKGYSFPKKYIWTQCFFENSSLMLSVASIPFGLFNFTGIICVIMYNKKEYRLATYLGAKIIKITGNEVIIKQNDMLLEIRLIKRCALPLLAPQKGNMIRTIHESASCVAYYRFTHKNQAVFEFVSDKASFEYEFM